MAIEVIATSTAEYNFQFGIALESLFNMRITDYSNNIVCMVDSSRTIRDGHS